MFESLKASAKAGADATARSAKTAKLKGEVMMLEQKVLGMKKDFGKDVYDAMVAGDKVNTERLFNETRAKVCRVCTVCQLLLASAWPLCRSRPQNGVLIRPLSVPCFFHLTSSRQPLVRALGSGVIGSQFRGLPRMQADGGVETWTRICLRSRMVAMKRAR
uniref:Uncharacterized protein n=1 Tax=Chrysotila carterae TaxID=13221 RepID=A0A6S9U520_CHRCT|mmetsp:Transcript_37421/g.82340  ORF Transcript_37421/g.82340 Transcript_37421/m.82340 type:complete len:161 (+) Transcript_37421:692-1174(+)